LSHSPFIFEFDTLDELRQFDESYVSDTRSEIMKTIAKTLHCTEAELVDVHSYRKQDNAAGGICFSLHGVGYQYDYICKEVKKI
jgi:hypothetical protein